MSYTNVQQVRHHLAAPAPVVERQTDQPLTFTGDDYLSFHGGAVEPNSVVVKSTRSDQPSRITSTLENGEVAFASGPVVAGSVVAASDSSLGSVYIENTDYIINYATGTLALKEGGGLTDGMSLTVWYLPYVTYAAGTDYQLRADRGEIRRLAGGDIAEGESVLLDYSPLYLSLTDEIISNAVVLANRMVENEVDTGRQFEADPMLGAAATFKALETVCRAAAGHELAAQRGNDRIATAWMKLADDYAGRSETMLKSFRPPFDSPRSPAAS